MDFSQPWFVWGVGLIVGFPIVVIALGELSHYLDAQDSSLTSPVKFLQRFLIPQLVFYVILIKVLNLPFDNVFVKINETLLWIFVIYSAISFFNLLMFNPQGTSSWQLKLPKLLSDVLRLFLVAIGSAVVLSNVWGFELGKMLAALGVGSIVLGLALQDTLSSLFAGFALLSSRQFKEGDWLKVGDNIGRVVHVSWRTTTLLNRDEDIILIPNSDLAKGQVINFSHPYPRHAERVNFDFSFDDPPHRVKEVLLQAAKATPGILNDPPAAVDLVSYDEFSVRHQARFWIAGYTDLPRIRDQFMSSIWYLAKREGLTFPTRAHEVTVLDNAVIEQEVAHDEIYNALNHSELLRDKDPLLLHKISEHSRVLYYGIGEPIVEQNVDSDDFYMILEGEAYELYTDEYGAEHQLNDLGKGDFCGLISLLRSSPDEYSVIAKTDVIAISIDEAHTVQMLDQHPELAEIIENMIEAQHFELEKINKRVTSLHSVIKTEESDNVPVAKAG